MSLIKTILLKTLNKILLSRRVSSTHKLHIYKLKSELNKITTPLQYTDIRCLKHMGPKTYKLIIESMIKYFSNSIDILNPVFQDYDDNSAIINTTPIDINTAVDNTPVDNTPADINTTPLIKLSISDKKKPYIPSYNSNNYKILKILYLVNQNVIKISKNKLSQRINPQISSQILNYSLKFLIKKSLVNMEDRKYYLSEKGYNLCLSLFIPVSITNTPPSSPIISMIIDSREIKSKKSQLFFQEQFINKDISILTRNLSVGDFIWIVKTEGDEFILPYLIERKCLNDFLSSINSIRLFEQLNRLNKYKNIFYLIELEGFKNFSEDDKVIVKKHLNILKQSNLTVLESKNIYESVELITIIDSHIRNSFKSGYENELINYDLFELEASKNLNLNGRDVFESVIYSIKGFDETSSSYIIDNYKNLSELFKEVRMLIDYDYLLMESTYPNRIKRKEAKKLQEMFFLK